MLFVVGAVGGLSDGDLLGRFATLQGDPSELAFAALVERHGPMVLRVARAVLGDEHGADDAFQATFLLLARKARSLWVRDSLGPWLHAVAFRVASQSRSAEARRRRRENQACRPETVEVREWDGGDLARLVHEEIGRLPRPYRLAVVTCHLEGLTQHEAASRLGWPVGTLQSRLARGRQRLRDRLERRGLAPSFLVLSSNLARVPPALLASTAKVASALGQGGATAGLIAPAVLAMIETTTKGMLMTKLKFGALAFSLACGLVVSGTGLGVGRPVRATDGPSTPSKPDSEPRPKVAPEAIAAEEGDPIPPPADGPGFPYLLEFFETQSVIGLKHHQEVGSLIRHGYPIKSFDCALYGPDNTSPGRAEADRYHVNGYPEILIVDGSGEEIARIGGILTPAKIAAFYNENRFRSSKKTRADDPAPTARPVLGVFQAEWSGPCRQMIPEIARLRQFQYKVKVIDIDKSPEAAARFKIKGVPTFIILNDSGQGELARAEGFMTAAQLAEFVDGNKVFPGKSEPVRDQEPGFTAVSIPRPWETVVRVRVRHSNAPMGFGSGTIIRSDNSESIILTSAHILRPSSPEGMPSPKDFRTPIAVDLFDGKLTGNRPAMVGASEKDLPAEVVDFDLTEDVCLIRIRLGRTLPASPVVPPGWQIAKGMKMVSLGCSFGNDATAWDTTILDFWVPLKNVGSGVTTSAIKCSHLPKQGRSGGGLFTLDGYLAGVCAFADPAGQAGLYAPPGAIHRLLDRNDMTSLYWSPANDDLKTSRVDLPKVPTIVRDRPDGEEVEIDGPRRPESPTLLDPNPAPPLKSATLEPVPMRVVSEQDRRIDELERKLDKVLKVLEDLTREKPSSPPRGSFPLQMR